MNIMKSLLGNSGQTNELLSVLTRSGFSARQAEQFLPLASENVAEAAAGLELGAGAEDDGDLINELSQSVDIDAIAGKLGMDSDTVSNGLAALLPHLVKLLQGGDIATLLRGGGFGNLLGSLTARR